MLALSKKTDYALISLSYMAEHEGRVVSAREIAQSTDLPLPLLMQILKTLHQHEALQSTRGVKGGYRLAPGVERLSLRDLIAMLDGRIPAHPAPVLAPILALRDAARAGGHCPLAAMSRKLGEFLDEVKVFDLIRPGRRIDVPVESVTIEKQQGPARTGRQIYREQVQPA